MSEITPDSLENDVKLLIEMGMNHESQELFFQNLSILQSQPQFPFALLKIISNQELSISIRIKAIGLLRPVLSSIDDELIDDFWKEADSNLFYALRIPFSNLVNEIAILLSEIYSNFKERTISPIFPYLNDKLVETIQIPEFVENALTFAIDFGNFKILYVSFAELLPNFVLSEYSEKVIELASLLTLHWELFEEKIIPIIFEHLEELSINSIKYTCLLIGNILKHHRPQILIDFIIQCIENENDMIVFAAIESIYNNQMIMYQENLILALYKRLGNDANLCECNVSTLCLDELSRRYSDEYAKVNLLLEKKINESFESENEDDIRCAIRCFSILDIKDDDDLDKALNLLANFLNSNFPVDASYSMTELTKKHPNFFPKVFEVVFQVLSSDSSEVRYQIFDFLFDLSITIEPELSSEIKDQFQSEPFLGILLENIQNDDIQYDEFLRILKLIGSFCSIVQSFEVEDFNTLVQITIEILNKNSDLVVECFHIFSSIIGKHKEVFVQLFEEIGPIVWSFIEEHQIEDEKELKYLFIFFSKSVESASKFEVINEEFNKVISHVCEFAIVCINPSYSFLIQKYGWIFLYNIILYDKEVFDAFKENIIGLLVFISSKTNLEIIGIKCQFIIVFIDQYENDLNDEIKKSFIDVCYRGIEENVSDDEIDRQMCILCLMRLALKTPDFDIDENTMEDIKLMMMHHDDYIKDERMLSEMTKCLKALGQIEKDDDKEKEDQE